MTVSDAFCLFLLGLEEKGVVGLRHTVCGFKDQYKKFSYVTLYLHPGHSNLLTIFYPKINHGVTK